LQAIEASDKRQRSVSRGRAARDKADRVESGTSSEDNLTPLQKMVVAKLSSSALPALGAKERRDRKDCGLGASADRASRPDAPKRSSTLRADLDWIAPEPSRSV